ncbi:MAG: type 1 glutamine amidotransferase [Thermotogae bacterium]|nr:type 1 glutamine amidotransferase [Thermotogota bacterium]
MKVAILLEDLYDEREFIYPYYRLQEEGYDVVVVAPKLGTYKGKSGLKFEANAAVSDVAVGDFVGLVIPGGYAPDRLRRYPEILVFVREMDEARKPIAAICHAGWVLISAGIVKGRRLTGFFAIKDDLINAGAHYVDEPVVVDGNLITSRGPSDLKVWMKEFIRHLKVLQ